MKELLEKIEALKKITIDDLDSEYDPFSHGYLSALKNVKKLALKIQQDNV